jgi:uncharacterized LabA/DUF88 family protein
MPNLFVFIDEPNMFESISEVFGQNVRLDLTRVKSSLIREKQVRKINNLKIVVYCLETPQNDVSKLRKKLSIEDIEVKSVPVKVDSDGHWKGKVDWLIKSDASRFVRAGDIFVLMSGNGTYVNLIRSLKARGAIVRVMACEEKVSHRLKRLVSDDFIPVETYMLKYAYLDKDQMAGDFSMMSIVRTLYVQRKKKN